MDNLTGQGLRVPELDLVIDGLTYPCHITSLEWTDEMTVTIDFTKP